MGRIRLQQEWETEERGRAPHGTEQAQGNKCRGRKGTGRSIREPEHERGARVRVEDSSALVQNVQNVCRESVG